MEKEEIEQVKEYFTNWNPVLYQNHPERLVSSWEIEQDKCTKNKMNILLNYIQQLEEREEKVKRKLKTDIVLFDGLRSKHKVYSPSEERINTKYHYANAILNLYNNKEEIKH